MTGTEIMAVVGFGILIFGTIAGAFWRFWALIAEAGSKGQKAQDDLASYKTHVAELYVTKAGMNEQTAQIMKAIDGVGDRLDGVNLRLDRVIETAQKPTRRAT